MGLGEGWRPAQSPNLNPAHHTTNQRWMVTQLQGSVHGWSTAGGRPALAQLRVVSLLGAFCILPNILRIPFFSHSTAPSFSLIPLASFQPNFLFLIKTVIM